MSLTVCPKGHDRTTSDVARGRYTCAGCERDRKRRLRAVDPNRGKGRPKNCSPDDPKVPAEPLQQIVLAFGIAEFARVVAQRHGRTTEAVQRAVHRLMKLEEVSVYLADHYAIGIGRHPLEIWGWSFYADLKEASDADPVQ